MKNIKKMVILFLLITCTLSAWSGSSCYYAEDTEGEYFYNPYRQQIEILSIQLSIAKDKLTRSNIESQIKQLKFREELAILNFEIDKASQANDTELLRELINRRSNMLQPHAMAPAKQKF